MQHLGAPLPHFLPTHSVRYVTSNSFAIRYTHDRVVRFYYTLWEDHCSPSRKQVRNVFSNLFEFVAKCVNFTVVSAK